MKLFVSLRLLFGFAAVCQGLLASEKITVTVINDLDAARPAEMISIPWDEVAKRLPGAWIDQLAVKDASGAVVPYQVTNFQPEEHHDYYLDLLFQHNFTAGEHTATFTIEKTNGPVPPFPAKVFARYIPERFDDFGWENDRVAHRAYGPGLDTPVAGKSRMISSGIDIWCKRVSYPIVDRWYRKGHYHDDSGEGLDMYDVGKSRGAGGLGIWDGKALKVSNNWKTWKVLANGPIRAVFELSYEPWDAGNGVMVSETKRFTVDAGHNLDLVESTFTFQNAADLTVAVGLGKHPKADTHELAKNQGEGWLSLWEKFPKGGAIGCGVLLAPAAESTGFAEDDLNHLILTKIKSGQTALRYYVGGCWSESGQFANREAWEAYLAAQAQSLKSPLKVSLAGGQ